MRKAARIVLALVVLAGGLLLLPGPTSNLLSPDATAQIVPTPTIPPIGPTPLPDPIGGGDDDDDDDDGNGGGQGDDQQGDGGSGGNDGPDSQEGEGDNAGSKKGDRKGDGKKKKRGGRLDGKFTGPVPSGTFSTERLMAAAARLTALGLPRQKVVAKVFPPFIIAGEAAWTNTWGAPRFGPGALVRTHEGQDVFCRYGDPVLAPEPGLVSYSDGGLGGTTARVHTSSKSYWYLTHLSATNHKQYPAGSVVETGDVVGFCGNSGNAATTPPHVHFGWYVNGKARNPMRALVSWLREAERGVGVRVARQSALVVAKSDLFTVERRFGDFFTSDVSVLDIPTEFLQAPATDRSGPMKLTEAALQSVLADALAAQEASVSAGEGSRPTSSRRLEKALTGISEDEHTD